MLFVKLVGLYGRYGFTIRSSISPFLLTKLSLNSAEDGTFTYAFREGSNIGNLGGGISMSEVALIEDVGQVYAPKRIFAIGCSFGWSTLALALAMPNAKIVAIDIGMGNGKEGLALTNQIAKENGLNVTGILGASPDDLAATVAAHLDGPIDMVFIERRPHQRGAEQRLFRYPSALRSRRRLHVPRRDGLPDAAVVQRNRGRNAHAQTARADAHGIGHRHVGSQGEPWRASPRARRLLRSLRHGADLVCGVQQAAADFLTFAFELAARGRNIPSARRAHRA
jgi:hypothetical protein